MKRIPVTSIRSKTYKVNYGPDEPCLLCGRSLRPETLAKSAMVHLATDGTLTIGETIDSQGCFPVGPECIKRVPREYYFKVKCGKS